MPPPIDNQAPVAGFASASGTQNSDFISGRLGDFVTDADHIVPNDGVIGDEVDFSFLSVGITSPELIERILSQGASTVLSFTGQSHYTEIPTFEYLGALENGESIFRVGNYTGAPAVMTIPTPGGFSREVLVQDGQVSIINVGPISTDPATSVTVDFSPDGVSENDLSVVVSEIIPLNIDFDTIPVDYDPDTGAINAGGIDLGILALDTDTGEFSLAPSDIAKGLKQGQVASLQVFYSAVDDEGASAQNFLKIDIQGLDDAPTAVDDILGRGPISEDETFTFNIDDLIRNDFDIDGDDLSITNVDLVSDRGATITMGPDGQFTYDPTQATLIQVAWDGTILEDEFQYQLTDSTGLMSYGTATISLSGVGNFIQRDKGNTNLNGNSGEDTILGSKFDDLLKGKDGNDFFEGGKGDDRIYGNEWGDEGSPSDIDTVFYLGDYTDYKFSAYSYAHPTLGKSVVRLIVEDSKDGGLDGINEGKDTLRDIDQLVFQGKIYDVADILATLIPSALTKGTSGDDLIQGDAGVNSLKGYAGSDTFIGSAGDDKIFGHTWGDRGLVKRTGEAGPKPKDEAPVAQGPKDRPEADEQAPVAQGPKDRPEAEPEVPVAQGPKDKPKEKPKDDDGPEANLDTVIYAGNFADYSFQAKLYDHPSFKQDVQRLYVRDSADGGFDGVDEGRDQLQDIDVLQFNDATLNVELGNDYGEKFALGAEDNIIAGLGGQDVFFFNSEIGHDVIIDFGAGEGIDDRIVVDGDYESYEDLLLSISDDGKNTTITFDANNSLQLQGVTVDDLAADDFIFPLIDV